MGRGRAGKALETDQREGGLGQLADIPTAPIPPSPAGATVSLQMQQARRYS